MQINNVLFSKGNKENDVWIFALTVLLSSTLVYNSIGIIDQHAIEDLQYSFAIIYYIVHGCAILSNT